MINGLLKRIFNYHLLDLIKRREYLVKTNHFQSQKDRNYLFRKPEKKYLNEPLISKINNSLIHYYIFSVLLKDYLSH